MTRLVIMGAKGRMGQMLVTCAARNPDFQVVGQIDIGDELGMVIRDCDVVIDFSFHEVTRSVAVACSEHGKPLVIGTTGHAPEERAHILKLVATIPVVWSSNYSTGVNTLFWVTRKAAEALGEDFDVEIIEMHHRMKKDAPSGTANSLAEILAEVRGLNLPEAIRYGRAGIIGERTATEIGMHSLRGGDVVGDHTVMFTTNGERLELTHRASSRETFANGALRAAQWIIGKPSGLYDMQDVLGLR